MATVTEYPDNPILYPQNRFDLEIDALDLRIGTYMQVQGLTQQIDVTEYPEGGRNDYVHKLPTRIKQGNLTVKRGITSEPSLLAWFQFSVIQAQPKTITLTLRDSEGSKVQAWSFDRAYPIKWTGSDLNAGGNEIVTESLEIVHHGMTVH